MMYVLEGEFTLFAPTDAAFAVYKDNLLSPSAPNAQAIYQGMYCFFNITRLIWHNLRPVCVCIKKERSAMILP